MLNSHSRKVLSPLQNNYIKVRDDIEMNDGEKNKTLADIDAALSETSLGVEHLFREFGQIYEAVFEGLIPAILLLLFYYKLRVKNGLITSFFLINYGLSRIIIENFRMPDIQVGLKFNLLSQGQLLSIPIVILGFYFLYLCQYKQR